MPEILSLVFKNPVVAFIILVGVVVFVHELGHYLVGVLFKLKIDEFSLGFGPKAFGFYKNGTEYKVSWLPLGGYVKFSGVAHDSPMPTPQEVIAAGKNPEHYLPTAKVYKRFLVSIAGPMANFILSFVIMIALAKSGLPAPDSTISVMPNSPAQLAGLKTGDKIVRINSEKVRSWIEINKNVSTSPGVNLELEVLRPGKSETIVINIVPSEETGETVFGEKQKVGRIGVSQFFSVPKLVVSTNSLLGAANFPNDGLVKKVGNEAVTTRHEVVQKLTSYFASCENLLSKNCQIKIEYETETDNLKNKNLKNENPEGNTSQNNHLGSVILLGSEVSSKLNSTLQNNSQLLENLLEESVISTDLTIGEAETLKKGDRKIEAQSAWEICGVKPRITLLGNYNDGIFSRWQDPMGLAVLLTKINTQLKENARNKLPTEKFVSVNLKILQKTSQNEPSQNKILKDESWEEKQIQCSIPTREAYGSDGRLTPFLDFPFRFKTSGVAIKPVEIVSETLADAIKDGSRAALNQGFLIFTGIKKLVTGSLPLSNLGGPIAIAKVAQDAAEGGLLLFLLTISGMSMNIGMFNLLPLPSLDGGAILLQLIEALYGKPPSYKVQLAIQKAGIFIIIILFILVFYNDIFRLIKS
jgi:regulator of sigma E protease